MAACTVKQGTILTLKCFEELNASLAIQHLAASRRFKEFVRGGANYEKGTSRLHTQQRRIGEVYTCIALSKIFVFSVISLDLISCNFGMIVAHFHGGGT